ncbi:MAG: hypothetical protein ACE5H0_12155, partial [Bacteroidota bacterium]
RAFWILDDLTPLQQLSGKVASSDLYLFKPRAAYRMRRGGFATRGVGQNPPHGVIVQYYFREETEEEVTLEFLDGDGRSINSFKSGPQKTRPAPDPVTAFFVGGGSRQQSLFTRAGMNRFVWDMRHPDGVEAPGGSILFGGSVRGPLVVPGTYQVRLTAGGRSLTERFEIRKDPRLPTTQEDFEEQFALLMRIRHRVSEAHQAAQRILTTLKQLEAAEARARRVRESGSVLVAAKELKEKLTGILDELVQLKIRRGNDVLSFPVKLNNEISSIGRVVASSDTRPTDQAHDALNELSAALDVQLEGLKEVMEEALPAFNQLLLERKVPGVSPR